MEDWHNLGADYDKTLMAWHSNFKHSWGLLKEHYDDRFIECGVIIYYLALALSGHASSNSGKLYFQKTG
jgi:cyclopropane-fatty-acyl-phospholipid synthase